MDILQEKSPRSIIQGGFSSEFIHERETFMRTILALVLAGGLVLSGPAVFAKGGKSGGGKGSGNAEQRKERKEERKAFKEKQKTERKEFKASLKEKTP
ncbi:MAG TPA: hypothetical protein PLY73_16000, partial [Candidatus Ozemobacteraceae bacterium]|nr:hypothetical protein [Candidatus Ozemobacteraceae bacterium]